MIKLKLNKEIVKGKKYALVGSSGCGKSTVANLLCKFYEPGQGSISIDGKSFQAIDCQELRNKISLVTQTNQLFRESVWENIRYGRLESLPEEIEQAAKALGIYDCIENRRSGLNIVVNDQAMNLSGGQKQRIAIARAVLKNAEVLILDEATSALDSEGEKAVFETLRRAYRDKTMIVISHRFSTIKDVDEVICLGQGKVLEKGPPETLIQEKGYFWALFQDQIESANIGVPA